MKKKLILAIIAVLIIFAALFAFTNNGSSGATEVSVDANALEDRGNLVVDSKSLDENKGLYHTAAADTNAILVKNGGALKLADSILNKTGDTATSGDDADFYGVNSAVLVNTNGTLDISNVEINTNSKGSNGIFVTNAESSGNSSSGDAQGGEGGQPPEATGNGGGEGGQPPEMPEGSGEGGQSPGGNGGGPGETTVSGTTEANIKNVKITTHSDKSRGLDATYNGLINAENVIINTDGQSCAALATDRGDGQVHVKNSDINTGVSKSSGRGSPLIYSTGNITLENSKGTSYVSQIACIEGKNSIELTNCDLKGYAEGNRKDGDAYVDSGGVFIYQSMSGDADVGTSTFTAKNSILSIESDSEYYKTAPMFHVTNTKAIINLESTELNYGGGLLLNVSGQSQWGTVGSNGGEVSFNANSEILDGDIYVDSISSLNLTLTSTSFVGAINPDDDYGSTVVTIESGSDWTLDGDSHITSLEKEGEINYNGHTLYVNGVAYTEENPY